MGVMSDYKFQDLLYRKRISGIEFVLMMRADEDRRQCMAGATIWDKHVSSTGQSQIWSTRATKGGLLGVRETFSVSCSTKQSSSRSCTRVTNT